MLARMFICVGGSIIQKHVLFLMRFFVNEGGTTTINVVQVGWKR